MVTGNRGPVLEAEFGTRGDAEHCDAPTPAGGGGPCTPTGAEGTVQSLE